MSSSVELSMKKVSYFAQFSLLSYTDKLDYCNFACSKIYSLAIIILYRKEQLRFRSACTVAQADLHLCCFHATKAGFLAMRTILRCLSHRGGCRISGKGF